ncbi:hypothetical protein [Sulfuracidifex metallicus]|uniref:hypothetical protein n=1 Tax=Sulfuracidifex metallicus TaxID=47303 RepID=UPI0022743AD6|nr:hypothetical protein [Sulfuracidifex metallicus]MCY0849667.1 hypothetical protein [Sulfuracidifex metallicus]
MQLRVLGWEGNNLVIEANGVTVILDEKELRDIVDKTERTDLGDKVSQPMVEDDTTIYSFNFDVLQLHFFIDWTLQKITCIVNGNPVSISGLRCFGIECLAIGIFLDKTLLYYFSFSYNERRATLHLFAISINSFINETIFYKLNKKFKAID